METRSNHILVGGVVLALLLAVVGFTVWISQSAGGADKQYDIFFKQAVDGLNKGSAVTFSGVPVGQVDSIGLMPNSPEFVRVRIAVKQDTPVLQGTTATIKSTFTGISTIQLDGAVRGTAPISHPGPFGVPVIPTKPGALGQLLNSAPELLERVSTLTARLTELLGDKNQQSIAGILHNLDVVSRNVAARSPEITATLADARVAIRQAGVAAEQMGKTANSADRLLNDQGRPLMTDLRHSIRRAETTMQTIDDTLGEAKPGLQALTKQTIPEIGQLVRDLREMSASLSSVAQKLDQQGAGALVGGPKLPDYNARKRK
jgi:phospholipid/cholesterol/gamma-HCH transport system substrate-binding protein